MNGVLERPEVDTITLDETILHDVAKCQMGAHDCDVEVTHACFTSCGHPVLLCDMGAEINRDRIVNLAWSLCGDCDLPLGVCWKVVPV